jgi:hypothetical protein
MERSRWRGQTGEATEYKRRLWRMDFFRRSMPTRRRGGGGGGNGHIFSGLLLRWSQTLSQGAPATSWNIRSPLDYAGFLCFCQLT